MPRSIEDLEALYEARLQALIEMLNERDKRYDERYENRQEWLKVALQALKDANRVAMENNQRAIEKAEAATEKRFDGVNEFRNTLADQQRTFMPRSELEALMSGIHHTIETNNQALVEIRTTNATNHNVMRTEWLAGIDVVQKQITADREQKKGISQGWGLAASAGAFVLLILGIVSGFAIYMK